MDPVLGSIGKDLIWAGVLGAVGGFGLALLQEKGLEMPHPDRQRGVTFIDLGFVADVLVGALAALIVYAMNPPSELLQFLVVTITAGIGGSAVLKSYANGAAAREWANRAQMYRAAAEDASKGGDVSDRLSAMAEADTELYRRRGPR